MSTEHRQPVVFVFAIKTIQYRGSVETHMYDVTPMSLLHSGYRGLESFVVLDDDQRLARVV